MRSGGAAAIWPALSVGAGAARAAASAMLVVCVAAPAPAQRATVFRGIVSDSAGHPIEGVRVAMREAGDTVLTDSAGRFMVRGLPPELYHVSLRRPGYFPISGTARIADGDSIDLRFHMRTVVLELDTVRANAPRLSDVAWWTGFEQRRLSGFGVYLTSQDLANHDAMSLANLIRDRASGVELEEFASSEVAAFGTHTNPVGCGAGSNRRPCSNISDWPDRCYMRVFLDGRLVYMHLPDNADPPIDLNSFRLSDVAAVEIYRGPADTPLEFTGTGSECGTLVIWTHRGERQP